MQCGEGWLVQGWLVQGARGMAGRVGAVEEVPLNDKCHRARSSVSMALPLDVIPM